MNYPIYEYRIRTTPGNCVSAHNGYHERWYDTTYHIELWLQQYRSLGYAPELEFVKRWFNLSNFEDKTGDMVLYRMSEAFAPVALQIITNLEIRRRLDCERDSIHIRIESSTT